MENENKLTPEGHGNNLVIYHGEGSMSHIFLCSPQGGKISSLTRCIGKTIQGGIFLLFRDLFTTTIFC